MKRFATYLQPELIKRLKLAAVTYNLPIYIIISSAVNYYLDSLEQRK